MPVRVLDPDEHDQLAIIEACLATIYHFFGGPDELFRAIQDPRVPELITYPWGVLGFVGILMFLCHLGARRQIALMFRGNGPAAVKFGALFDVDTCPHGDTLNTAASQVEADQMQEAVTDMTRTLIRKKVLYRYRLLDRYFVAIDGTGRLTFPERHCPNCLTAKHHGKTIYYHPVLEAKLVAPNGFVFSLMTEFIENPKEHPNKQDCELKAFYRLTKRLKKAFPRLPICLSLDSLFACGPVMSMCEDNGWKYMIVHKKKSIPYIQEEFEALVPLAPENHLRARVGPQREIKRDYRWINDISYVDSDDNEHTVGVLECLEDKPDEDDGKRKTKRFRWITNFNLKTNNVIALANQGGRIRWKIENEGFNVQKNGGYNLEHAYTTDPVASKVFYFFLQMAHLIAQLTEKGSLFRRAFPDGVGSAKNIAFRLLESWRNLRVSAQRMRQLLEVRRQIRLAPT